MKKKIKRLIPERIIILRSLLVGYLYDLRRYFKYSNSFKKRNTEQHYQAIITYTYHVIEKGLTMPEPRLGFGQGKIETLIDLCKEYLKSGYSPSAEAIIHSVRILNEYLYFHENQNYPLPANLISHIRQLSTRLKETNASQQLEYNRNDFFKYFNAPFNEFCLSRHTVRNYSDENIPLEIFQECAELAQKSPSACNRQPNHVYILKNKSKMEEVLKLQSGNRGFGHLANALVIFTGDVSAFRFQDERNEIYFNSGLFAMSFIYALHYKKIGSCALNWSVTPDKDKKLRKLIKLPENETITLILSCGYLPDKVKIASSPRYDIHKIFHTIQ